MFITINLATHYTIFKLFKTELSDVGILFPLFASVSKTTILLKKRKYAAVFLEPRLSHESFHTHEDAFLATEKRIN